MNAKTRASIPALLFAVLATVSPVHGITAVYGPSSAVVGYMGGNVYALGFSGLFDLSVPFQTGPSAGISVLYSLNGATAYDRAAYTLLNPDIDTSSNSVLVMSDPHTGALQSQVSLDRRLSDIAFANGRLYGITNSTTDLQIVSIGDAGSTQIIFDQPAATFPSIGAFPNWRLSGATAGNQLLATPAGTIGINSFDTLITTSDLSFSQFKISPMAFGDTIINVAGTLAISPLVGIAYALPGGARVPLPAGTPDYSKLFPSVSDEFNYSYPAASPARAVLSTAASLAPVDGLIHSPIQFSDTLTLSIQNGISPDGVTLTNLAGHNLVQQLSGPTAATIQEIDAAPGDLSSRSIGQATINLNLAKAQRGIYSFGGQPTVTADYTYGPTTELNRPVSVPSGQTVTFAYDPPSANLVGNGDASLGTAGWQGTLGNQLPFNWISQHVVTNANGFSLTTDSGQTGAMRQLLQLPTPAAPMLLSFTYQLGLSYADPNAQIEVELNGIKIGQVNSETTAPQTFQAILTDTTLQNLNNAELLFQLTDNARLSIVDLTNISLSAVPEPASTSVLLVAISVQGAFHRRRKIAVG